MKKKKKRLSLRLNLISVLLIFLFFTYESVAQLKIRDDVTMDVYKYPDIPFLIFHVNVSNSGLNDIAKLNEHLFIVHHEKGTSKIFPFYLSSSLNKISARTISSEGIIAFRGTDGKFMFKSSVNDSLKSDLIKLNTFDNYKEEAYALAIISALENYRYGDTLVYYYYEKYYKDINSRKKIQEDNYLKDYLEGALIRGKNIYENKKEDLSIPEIKEIINHYSESRNKGNNDSIFNLSLRNYYLEIARYYSKSEKKDYDTIARYYEDAMDIELKGESFENSDLFNFSNALFYIEQDNWAEDLAYDFSRCRQFYERLINKKYKLCEIYLKLGAIYYMENYPDGDFSESKKYFNMVIDNNCRDQAEKARKNLSNIKSLENK